MAKRKDREVLTGSLNEEPTGTINEKELDLTDSKSSEFASIEPPSLKDSPLLNTERNYVEHSAPLGSQQSAASAPVNPPIGGSSDSFSYEDNSAPLPPKIKLEANNPNFFNTPSNPMLDNPPHVGLRPDALNLPDESAKEASNHLSDFIIDAYERFVPDGGFYFAKINTKEIKKLEDNGTLGFGSYNLVVDHNKETKKKLEERAKEDTKYIKKHLRKVLQVRNIQASPETLLAGAILMVVVGQYILITSLREDRDVLMNNIMAKINTNASQSFNSAKDEIPLVQTEEVA